MEKSLEQQIFEQIKKAGKILIALPQTLTADSLASGLALKLFLEKLQKDVELVSSGRPDEHLKFMPGIAALKSKPQAGKSLVVVLDTSVRKLDEVSYETAEHQTKIFLKAKDGLFEQKDISFAADKFSADLVMVLDSRSLEDLGQVFAEAADIFYETPKINLSARKRN